LTFTIRSWVVLSLSRPSAFLVKINLFLAAITKWKNLLLTSSSCYLVFTLEKFTTLPSATVAVLTLVPWAWKES